MAWLFVVAFAAAGVFFLRAPRRARAEELIPDALFERLSSPLLLCGAEPPTTIIKANSAFIRLFGRAPAPGETPAGIFGPACSESILAESLAIVRRGEEAPAVPFVLRRENAFPLAAAFAVRAAHADAVLLELRVEMPTPEDIIFGRAVREALPGWIVHVDAGGLLREANAAACAALGKSVEELRGKPVAEILGPAAGASFHEAAEQMRVTRRPHSAVEVLPSAGGGARRVEIFTMPLFGAAGEYIGMLVLGRDVEEQYRTVDVAEHRGRMLDAVWRAVEVLLAGGDGPLTDKLRRSLDMLGSAAEVNRVFVWRNRVDAEGRLRASQILEWLDGVFSVRHPDLPTDLVVDESFPGRREILAAGRCVNTLVRDMSAQERERLGSMGILSVLVAPIMLNEEFWGFIGFDDRRIERVWNSEEERILRAAGSLIGSALAHEQTNENLRLSEERFRNVAEATGEVIWEMGPDECITFMSPGSVRLTGRTPEELVGLSIDVIGGRPEFLVAFRADLRRQIAEKGFFRNLEHDLLDTHGHVHHLRTSGLPLFTAEGEFAGLRATSVDVTQERESAVMVRDALDALRQANQELEQYAAVTQDLAAKALAADRAKSEFLATIGHEVRTPINVITGMAYLALQTSLNPTQREYIEKVHSAGNTLLGIMNDILDFARMENEGLELEHHPLRLRDVVRSALAAFELQAGIKKIELTAETDPAIPAILRGDPARLGQIFKNLLHNALKFTEKGSVRVECLPESLREDGVVLLCRVKDSGTGIPPDRLECLFDAFTQADSSASRRYGGAGVGLALTKRLVEAMGGRIWITSALGVGTTVHFTVFLEYLPDGVPVHNAGDCFSTSDAPVAAPAAAVRAPERLDPALERELKRIEALLLDDDAQAVTLGRALRPRLAGLPGSEELLSALVVFDFSAALTALRGMLRASASS